MICLQIDCAIGCSEFISALYKILYKIKSSEFASYILKIEWQFIKSLTSGFPEVKVPVLSKTTTFIFSIFYKISAFLIKMPNEAASPVPTITAVGVARPSAQGHAMTRVEIPKSNAN